MDLDVNPDADHHLLCDLLKLLSISEHHCSHLQSEEGAYCHRDVKIKCNEIMYGRCQVLTQDLASSINSCYCFVIWFLTLL